MTSSVALLALGMALLVTGGHFVVEGASRLARVLGVSELVIGLTVVAFGTSVPELAVNVLAAVGGDASIAFGNVVGSNLANVALVIGLCALVRPLKVASVIVSREIPMMLLATCAFLIMGLDRIRGAREVYDFSDGLLLLLLFCVFLYYSVSEVVARPRTDPLAEAAAGGARISSEPSALKLALLAAAGLAALLGGAQLTVSHAVFLAEALGIPDVVIALTVIAIGTSLPELATCLVATSRGQTSLAVGNVVGSNIFNLLFVLGATALVRPIEVPAPNGGTDLLALAAFSSSLLPLVLLSRSTILRWQGAAMVLTYVAYLAWRVAA